MRPLTRPIVACLLLAGFGCRSPDRPEAPAADAWRLHWDDGLRYDSPDEELRLRLDGRLSYDVYDADGDDLAGATGKQLADDDSWRQRRLTLNGWAGDDWRFQTMWSFPQGGDDDVVATQTWLQWEGGPVDALKAGHFREPFGLESQTSLRHLPLAERSLPTNVFRTGRNTGIAARQGLADDVVQLAVGAFREANESFDGLGNETQLSARLTATPTYEDEGRQLVHAGFSLTRRDPDTDVVRLRARPETAEGDRLVDTGALSADRVDQLGAELAYTRGPFSAQGEWITAQVDRLDASDNRFGGWYGELGWFLTGEHRRFDRAEGRFKAAALPVGWTRLDELSAGGAWQLVGRYSRVDLDDDAVAGGQQEDLTLGLNWYAHRDLRVALNWIHIDLEDADQADVVLLRLQLTF